MFSSRENFNRKLEKISYFLKEVLSECCKSYGLKVQFEEFLEREPSFIKLNLQEFCNKTMKIISKNDNSVNLSNHFLDIQKENLNINMSADFYEKNKDKTTKNQDDGFPEFNFMKMFVKQYTINKEQEYDDLVWKNENYKEFMNEKSQRLFEMRHFSRREEENRMENTNLKFQELTKKYEEEKKELNFQIDYLKKILKKKDIELLTKEKVLKEKEEAILLKSLANNSKQREIFSMSKKIGEKDLLLLLQTKSHHQASKSFSNNLY